MIILDSKVNTSNYTIIVNGSSTNYNRRDYTSRTYLTKASTEDDGDDVSISKIERGGLVYKADYYLFEGIIVCLR